VPHQGLKEPLERVSVDVETTDEALKVSVDRSIVADLETNLSTELTIGADEDLSRWLVAT
jgi:hypothetical protein